MSGAVTLRLEAIGDDLAERVVAARRGANPRDQHDPRFWKHLYSPVRRPWVARIVGTYPSGKFRREFLEGQKDFRGANGTGSRGIYLYFHLEPGPVYEAFDLLSRTRDRRYFCRVSSGRLEEIPEAEVRACLS